MPVSFDHVFTVPDHVMVRELDDEAVLLNLESEAYFGLDPVGTRVLQLLRGSRTVQQVYEQLLQEYDVEPDRLRSDLEALLDALDESGLIILRANAAAP